MLPPAKANGNAADKAEAAKMTTSTLTPETETLHLDPPADPPNYNALKDPALIDAWRRFLDYDRVSTLQKRTYKNIREWVIILYFLTAAGAVFTAMIQNNNLVGETPLIFIRLALVVMPIISVGLNNYANQFASSTAWIEYRVGAETIREKIYLYRLRAGEFANLPNLQDRQRQLLEIINVVDTRINKAGATLPYMRPLLDEQRPGASVPEIVRTKTETPYNSKDGSLPYDDGFHPLTTSQYLDFRIRRQIDWYARRIDGDYSAMRKYRLFALIIAGAGSLIAAVGYGLEGMVAITTAAGVALTMKADSNMYGATYATYHLTASRLRTELSQWNILTPEQKLDTRIAADYSARMEKILSDERETWRSTAIELQNTVDRNVNASLRTDGNPIAVVTGRANTLEDYPMLRTTAQSADKTPLEVASALLLSAEERPAFNPQNKPLPVTSEVEAVASSPTENGAQG